MADVLTSQQRTRCMSRIRGKDTKPELVVRALVFALGYRYRLHVRTLSGCPDLVFPRLRRVILVHGCFWHRHDCAYGRPFPATRPEFWRAKFAATVKHDKDALAQLREEGWESMVVWECETGDADSLRVRLREFLSPNSAHDNSGTR